MFATLARKNYIKLPEDNFFEPVEGSTSVYDKNHSGADTGDNPSVNLAIGRLRYTFADLGIGNGKCAIDVSHVYNSIASTMLTGMARGIGNGWKLNAQQYIVGDGADFIKLPPKVFYIDGSGEVHTFVQFEGTRYYNERSPQTVLDCFERRITDAAGNTLLFDKQGRLKEISTSDTTPTVKRFVYQSDKLSKVLYSHSSGGAAVNRYIEMQYDGDLLSSMTVYNKANKKQLQLRYKYSNGNLVEVAKAVFGKNEQEVLVIQLWKFSYDGNNLLEYVTDCQTKASLQVEYYTESPHRVKSVHVGTTVNSAMQTGTQDSQQNHVAVCGELQCGFGSAETFKSLRHNTYVYNDLDDVSYETDITNEKDVTLAYFINRKSQIVSSFEKLDGNLLTLQKQGAKRSGLFAHSSGAQKINGYYDKSTTSGKIDLAFSEALDISRSKAEQEYKHFQYSFWLKVTKQYDRLQATISYTDSTGKSTSFARYVELDGSARNVWQRVSLPLITFSGDDAETKLTAATVKFYANGLTCADTLYVNEIGFDPAPSSKTYYLDGNTSNATSDINVVFINDEVCVRNNRLASDVYFTDNDIIQSYANRKGRAYTKSNTEYFDVICNNGTKRIASVKSLRFAYVEYSTATNNPNRLYTMTEFPSGDVKLQTEYNFTDDLLTIITYAYKDGERKSNTEIEVYYNGKVKSETDEYGILTKYSYDTYGNVDKKETYDSQGVVRHVETYAYDADGKMYNTTNGIAGQEIDYNDYEQAYKATSLCYDTSSNGFTPTSNTVQARYGVMQDRVINVKEEVTDEELNKNQITYQDGRIRTVTDGTVKYGVVYDLANSTVKYTQFDGDTETLVQKDTIGSFTRINGVNLQPHRSDFYDASGNRERTSTTYLDTYDKIRRVENYRTDDSSFESVTTEYTKPTESKFAAKPQFCTEYPTNTRKTYLYDDDGNLIAWSESDLDNNSKLLTVRSIGEGLTKYTFGESDDYFTQEEFDEDVIMSPRVTGVNVFHDDSAKYDNPTLQINRKYHYDTLGRIDTVTDQSTSTCKYEYKTVGNSYVLDNMKFNTSFSDNFFEQTLDLDIQYDYDKFGNMTKIDKQYNLQYVKPKPKEVSQSALTEYKYDSLNRLVSEKNTALGIDRTFTYRADGRLATERGSSYGNYTYDSRGRLHSVNNKIYYYDNYGNRTSKEESGHQTYYYYTGNGNLKKVNSSIEYQYNADNIRCIKQVGDVTTRYYLDGGKILGETRTNNATGETTELRYFYDANGLLGFKYNDTYYNYVKDALGNIIMVVTAEENAVVAKYEYDSKGNCKIYDLYLDEVTTNYHKFNPFKWKGFYYDEETGFYYANGSYYDPEVGVYVDATPISTAISNAYNPRCLDRNGILCNNLLEVASNPFTVNTTVAMQPDPDYEVKISTWDKIKNWFAKAVNDVINFYESIPWYCKLLAGVVFLALAIGLSIATYGTIDAVIGVIVSVALGVTMAVLGSILTSLDRGEDINGEELAKVALDSFLLCSFIAFVSSFVSFIKVVARSSPTPQAAMAEVSNETAVIGKMSDLKNYELQSGEYRVADLLIDMGNPKANWKQNSSVLRSIMQTGKPIKDISVINGQLVHNTGFLALERNLLINHGWKFLNGYWILGG